MKKQINPPKFNNEDEEREFWANIDLSDYIESADLQKITLPNLKPRTRPISIRFPEYVLDAVKERANELGVPYQSLIKQVVADAFIKPQQ